MAEQLKYVVTVNPATGATVRIEQLGETGELTEIASIQPTAQAAPQAGPVAWQRPSIPAAYSAPPAAMALPQPASGGVASATAPVPTACIITCAAAPPVAASGDVAAATAPVPMACIITCAAAPPVAASGDVASATAPDRNGDQREELTA